MIESILYYTEQNEETISCALKLKSVNEEVRIPMHFILLLDTSDSMNENNKLQNVKQCMRILMNILNPTDFISLVTFASDSRVWLRRVSADASQRAMIEQTIDQIQTDGMTNLSAGLSELPRILEGETLKTGLVLLTDGHANKGIHSVTELRRILNQIRETNSLLSYSSIAYGTDHNADLLKTLSEDANGSYSIVNTLEDTAVSIGDSLGGLMTCAYQNFEIHLPLGTTVEGPFRTFTNDKNMVIRLGDIYSGSDNLLLFKVKVNFEGPLVSLKGMSLPDFKPFDSVIERGECLTSRDKDIELTKLRYECAALWKRIRIFARESTLDADIESFSKKLDDEFLAGHPVLQMLKDEAVSLKKAIELARNPFSNEHQNRTIFAQHETSLGLGRGATSSIPAVRQPRIRRAMAQAASLYPDNDEEQDPTSIGPVLQPTMTSPYQNNYQRRVTSLMATLSQQNAE